MQVSDKTPGRRVPLHQSGILLAGGRCLRTSNSVVRPNKPALSAQSTHDRYVRGSIGPVGPIIGPRFKEVVGLITKDPQLANYHLKMQKFTPEDVGKLNFYLSAVDSQLRHPDDKPSIGLVLCKTRDRVTAEYALRDINKPIGVAEWQTKLVHSLPEPLRSNLPTIEQIEEELAKDPNDRLAEDP